MVAGEGSVSAESAGQDDATPGEGPPNSTPRRSPFYRFRRYCYRNVPSLFPDPDRREILRQSRSRDAEDNAKTTPPADELIDLRCVWAVEFYTPSQVSQLLHGFERLGWNKEDPTGFDRNPSVSIQQFRESALGGGWFNVGLIDRPGSRRFFPSGRTAPLPTGIDYALAAMYSLTSSITCIVVAFILTEEFSPRFDQALRRDRETILERLPGRRYRLPGPPSQKVADVKAIAFRHPGTSRRLVPHASARPLCRRYDGGRVPDLRIHHTA